MSDKLGEEFDAHISGVTEFGIYAEIDENHCEGLIAIRYLGDEAFDFDDKNYCLIGRQSHHRFSLGDPIRIRMAHADLFRKQLDYELVGHESSIGPAKPTFYESFVQTKKNGKPKHTGKAPKRNKKEKHGGHKSKRH